MIQEGYYMDTTTTILCEVCKTPLKLTKEELKCPLLQTCAFCNINNLEEYFGGI